MGATGVWFKEKLRRHSTMIAVGLTVANILLVTLQWAGKIGPVIGEAWHLKALVLSAENGFLLQVVVIAFLLWVAQDASPVCPREESRTAGRAVAQFRRYWNQLWIAWLFLYIAFFAREVIQGAGMVAAPQHQLLTALVDIPLNYLNNVSGLYLLACYWVLDRKTIIEGDASKGSDMEMGFLSYGYLLLTCMAALETAVVLWISADNQFLIVQVVQRGFKSVYGCANGIALSLLVGRLESRYLRISRGVIALLYLYAIIQVLWVADRQVVVLVTSCAFLLKIILFVVVQRRIENGILFFYMKKARAVLDTLGTEWEAFVRDHVPCCKLRLADLEVPGPAPKQLEPSVRV